MKNILVCIDFHDETQLLIDKAVELAEVFKSKLWLVHFAAPDPDFVGYDVGPQYIRDFRADELKKEHKCLTDYAKELQAKNIDSEGLLIQGSTIDEIIAESIKLNVDLIITGHHKHGFFFNLLVGSTSSKIIKESKIPVLTIPFEK